MYVREPSEPAEVVGGSTHNASVCARTRVRGCALVRGCVLVGACVLVSACVLMRGCVLVSACARLFACVHPYVTLWRCACTAAYAPYACT